MATTIGELAPWLIPQRTLGEALTSGVNAGSGIAANINNTRRLSQENRRMGFAADQANAELDLQSARQRMLEQAQAFKHQAELGELETGKENQQLLGDLLTKWNATTDYPSKLSLLSEAKYSPLLLDKRFQPIIGDMQKSAQEQFQLSDAFRVNAAKAKIEENRATDLAELANFGLKNPNDPADVYAAKFARAQAKLGERAAKEGITQPVEMTREMFLPSGDLNEGIAAQVILSKRPFKPESTEGKTLEDVRKLRDAGREEDAQKLEASMLDKGETFKVDYDDQGRAIVSFTKGGSGSDPTLATRSEAQKRLATYESVMDMMGELSRQITPETVGVKGTLGNLLIDRGLAQFIPGAASGTRMNSRAVMTSSREGILKAITSDPNRISNQDRMAVEEALPSSGVFESYESAQSKLNAARRVMAIQARKWAKASGEPAPVWALTPEQVFEANDAGQISADDAVAALEFYTGPEVQAAREAVNKRKAK